MRLHHITLVFMTATIIPIGCSSSRTQTRQVATPFHSQSVSPSTEYDSDPPSQVSSSSASVDLSETKSSKATANTVAPVPPAQEKVTRVKGVSLSRLLFGKSKEDCGTESPCETPPPGGARPGIFDCFSASKNTECAAQNGDHCAAEAAGCVDDSPGWNIPSRLYCPDFAVACVREVRTVGRYFCPPACLQPKRTDACGQENGCNESANCGDTRAGLLPSLFCYKLPQSEQCGGTGRASYPDHGIPAQKMPETQPLTPNAYTPEVIPAAPGEVPPIPQGIQRSLAEPAQPIPTDVDASAIPIPGVGAPQTTGDVPGTRAQGGETKQPLTPAPTAEPQSLVVPQAWPKLRTPSIATPVNPKHYYPSSWSLR